jgi:acylphosphatase
MTDRLHVHIHGRVQGVGFRYSAFERATALGLNGWVRNLPDGSVEAEFEGPKAVLQQMLAWCEIGPRAAKVTRVETTWQSGEPQYADFHFRG